jgi:hypothetical protein
LPLSTFRHVDPDSVTGRWDPGVVARRTILLQAPREPVSNYRPNDRVGANGEQRTGFGRDSGGESPIE